MKKFLTIGLAIACICAFPISASAHGGHHNRNSQTVYTAPAAVTVTYQCNGTDCLVDGVCNGTCTGTGSCATYAGCNSGCNGAQACIDAGICQGGHHAEVYGNSYTTPVPQRTYRGRHGCGGGRHC